MVSKVNNQTVALWQPKVNNSPVHRYYIRPVKRMMTSLSVEMTSSLYSCVVHVHVMSKGEGNFKVLISCCLM